jgi:hypothetical protein
MNRDRQIMKDIENKHEQAQEQYAENKSLMAEYKTKEKAADSKYQKKKENKKAK